MPREIIRGDSYEYRRPFAVYTLTDIHDDPFDLYSCKVFVTYKPRTTDPMMDADDSLAPIRHYIEIDGGGSVVGSSGLSLLGDASAGVIVHRLTKANTFALPANAELRGDLQLIDATGEVTTWRLGEPIMAVDGFTNRESQ